MALADDLKPILHSVRAIPGQLGLRPYSVAIVLGFWAGEYVGRGGKTEVVRLITESGGYPPKVRFLNEERRALGNLGAGSCEIGPITPDHATGGTALSRLAPAVEAHETVHVRLTGPAHPKGTLFLVKEVKTDRALHWTLVCEPVGASR